MYSIKQFINMLVKRLTYIFIFCFKSQDVKRMKLEILNKNVFTDFKILSEHLY